MENWLEKHDDLAVAGQECGVCIWTLAKNSVVANLHLAEVFDLPFSVARHGLPMERYIAKTHPDDRPKVAKALHEAIVSGRAYRQEYRLLHGDGTIVNVVCFGQCFPDENGIASQYVGVLFAASETQRPQSSERLLTLCRQAKDYAKDARNDAVSGLLELAVLQLTQAQPGARGLHFALSSKRVRVSGRIRPCAEMNQEPMSRFCVSVPIP